MKLRPQAKILCISTGVQKSAERDRVLLIAHIASEADKSSDGFSGATVEDGIGDEGVPGGDIAVGHFVEQVAGLLAKSGFGVHVEGAAGDEDVVEEAGLEREGVELKAGEGEAEGGGGLEEAGEGEVVGEDGGAAHEGEEAEGWEEVAVLDGAGDEGGEGDDGGGVGVEGEEGEGGGEAVELRVHVEEVDGEEGRDGFEGLEDMGVSRSTQEKRPSRHGRFDDGGERVGREEWHGWLLQKRVMAPATAGVAWENKIRGTKRTTQGKCCLTRAPDFQGSEKQTRTA